MPISECAPCGRAFTSLTGFDRHQEYRFGTATPVVCRDPAGLGMIQDAGGRWHFPATAAARLHHAKMRADRGLS